MRVTGLVAALAASCVVYFGAMAGAKALTINEYDHLVIDQKENFVSTVLHFYYYNYKNNPDTTYEAKCMVRLDKASTSTGKPYLMSLITQHLNSARADPGKNKQSVEGIIKQVIEQECRQG